MSNKAVIEITGLSKAFVGKDKTVEALEDINLTINEGEIYGIIGMSGAGKSTLVRCMNYLEKPTTGTVVIDGKDLSKCSDKELREVRHKVSMIFQHFNLLMQRNVEDNVRFPLEIIGVKKEEAKKKVAELLEIVGLSDKAKSYPAQLSGGQKQRVAIARALATEPGILLCDEATSALDPSTTDSILKLLKEINERMKITIVMITHQMSVVEDICQKVAIIDNGRLVETGTVEEVFTRPATEVARKLVYQTGEEVLELNTNRCIRIVFDGGSSYEPVIANMVLECKVPVNIIFANTKDIDGQAFGQIVLQLPEDEVQAAKAIHYLRSRNLKVEELDGFNG
ncbi:MAG: ATP-binding cassette domain-containing protein [Lachnospiraceae bacterium]|nr:ATP-binding cassette domain-containing protein [Lachnospiraceae bacterium]